MSDMRNPGDAWVVAADGGRYWGKFGAAGLIVHDRGLDAILLQHRVEWSDHGGTWGIPGGAKHEGECAVDAAIRESHEEAAVPFDAVLPRYTHVLDRGGWSYTTLVADASTPFEPRITDPESVALAWIKVDEVDSHDLHPAFANSWPKLKPLLTRGDIVIVDAMNVVGSVPDGWWKDRRAANERLRDRVSQLAGDGVRAGFIGLDQSKLPGIKQAFPEWIFVTEGPARGIDQAPGLTVVHAEELGDDTIVEQVREHAGLGKHVTVITNDEELRTRVKAAGAHTIRGTQKLIRLLPDFPDAPDQPAEPEYPAAPQA